MGRPGRTESVQGDGSETETRVGTASLTWLRRTQTQEQSSRPGRRPVVGCRSRGRRRNKTARRRLPLLRPGSIGIRTACYVHASIPASSWTGGPLASGLILGRAIDRPSITRLPTTSWRRRFQENSSLQCKSDRQTACVFTRNCQLVYCMQCNFGNRMQKMLLPTDCTTQLICCALLLCVHSELSLSFDAETVRIVTLELEMLLNITVHRLATTQCHKAKAQFFLLVRVYIYNV